MDALLVCSHRGPVSHHAEGGRIVQRQGSGGLVTALAGVLRGGKDVRWLACALSEVDRQVAGAEHLAGSGPLGTRLLVIPPEVHRRFYDDACVTGLGFLFHGLVDQVRTPTYDAGFQAAWSAYRQVNRAYAQEVARWGADRAVLVEDYHLMLVAAGVRELDRDHHHDRRHPVAYFHHVPWCPPVYFAMLPKAVRTEILTGMLAFDTVGFHARRWADQFLACCADFLPGADCGRDAVSWQGREIPVVVAPAQLDVPHIRELVAGPDAARWRATMTEMVAGRRAVVRVDRVELWKNIVRGFTAFEALAAAEGIDDVTFLAVLGRSRMHLPVYRDHLAECQRAAQQVNERLAARGYCEPIQLLVADPGDHSRALAALGVADVVLVNATSDGLNLVAKEAALAASGRSRLVLSENTGAYEEIGDWSHPVNPFDIDETATAMSRALREDASPAGLLAAVAANSPDEWLRRRLRLV